MKKSHLLILAGVLVLLVTMCIGISADEGTVAKIGENEYTSLTAAINASADGDEIIITADNVFSDEVYVTGKNITIKSADPADIKTITYVSKWININGTEANPGSVTLENIVFTKQKDAETGAYVADGTYAIMHPLSYGTAILNSGATIRDSKSMHAGAVFAEGGAIIINDGALIENCSNSWRAGGIAVDNGSFTMNGGTIKDCTGGAILLGSSATKDPIKAVIKGGTITGNTNYSINTSTAAATADKISVEISDSLVCDGSISLSTAKSVTVMADSGNLKTALSKAFAYRGSSSDVIISLTKATEAKRASGTDNYFNNRVFTVDGNGNTLSIEKDFPMWGTEGHITFKNATVEMNNFILGNDSKMTFDEGSILTTPAGGVTTRVISVQGGSSYTPTVTMKSGSAIKNAKSGSTVISLDIGVATLTVEDGVTVSGVEAKRLVDCYQQSIANIAGATITENTFADGVIYAVAKTINITNPSALTVDNNGSVKIINVSATNDVTVNITGDWDSALTVDNKNYYIKKYIVAKNDTTLYTSINDAITGTNNKDKVIYLLSDCDFNAQGIERSYILDGQGHTVNLKGLYNIVGKSNVTFRNVIFDLGTLNTKVTDSEGKVTGYNPAFTFWNGCTLTLDSGAVIRNYTATGDEYFNTGFVFRLNEGGEGTSPKVIMKDGSLIENINLNNRDGHQGVVAYVNRNAVFEIQGGTIQNIRFGQDADNVNASHGAIYVADGGTLNMTGGTIQNVKTPSRSNRTGGAVFIAGGGTFNMTGGLMTNNFALEGGAVYLRGTMNMTGGEITGNYSWSGSGIRVTNGVLNISGDAKVINNVRGQAGTGNNDNVMPYSKDMVSVAGDFTGQMGLKNLGTTVGAECGAVTSGTLKNINCVVNDDDHSLFAYIKDGKLCWTVKPALTVATDTGKYTKGEDTETVYGVVRALTTSETAEAIPVEKFGTYFVKSAAGVLGTKNYFVGENGTFEQGAGYIADLVDIEGNASVYAVNYYKFAGIDDYVFADPIAVSYDAEKAKNLGADPEDLKYE